MQPVTTEADWQAALAALPHTHLLQTWPWGALKSRYGWTAARYVWHHAGKPVAAAQVLRREQRVLGRWLSPAMLYTPKGPLFAWDNAALRKHVLDDLQALAKHEGALLLKIDPDVLLATGEPDSEDDQPNPSGAAWQTRLAQRGWVYAREQVQFRNTVTLDLSMGADDLLASFKSKTRYNIRLAGRKGVVVRAATRSDLPGIVTMYATTAARDGFIIRSGDYYLDAWTTLMDGGLCQPLLAEVDGTPVAALVLTFDRPDHGGVAYYMYGMSTDMHRNLMPTYALQWAAIETALARGCTTYDLWGAPDVFAEDDPLWGVWRFKRGFEGMVVRTLGAWDYPAKPLGYRLFTRVYPWLLRMRRAIAATD